MLNDDTNNDGEGSSQQDKLDEAISIFQLIESVLGGDEEEVPSEVSFEYPVHDILSLLPEHYVVQSEAGQLDDDETVRVSVEDLYQQLQRGKVEVSVSKLCFSIPTNLVTSDALIDTTTVIKMPLQKVVMALNPRNLRDRTTQDVKPMRVEGLDDPFAKPDVKGTVVVDPQAKMRANAEEAAREGEQAPEEAAPSPESASAGIGISETVDAIPDPFGPPAVPPEEPSVPSDVSPTVDAIPDPFGAPAPVADGETEDDTVADVSATEEDDSSEQAEEPALVAAVPDPFGVPAPSEHESDSEELVTDEPVEAETSEQPEESPLVASIPDPFGAPASSEADAVADEPVVETTSEQPDESPLVASISDPFGTPAPTEHVDEGQESSTEDEPAQNEVPEQADASPLVASIPDPFGSSAPPAPEAPVEDATAGDDEESSEDDEPVEEDEELVAAVAESSGRFEERESFGGVNLNAAGKETLMTLDGVSPALADTIINYREANGPFESIFDLGSVPRLGRKTFRRITGMPFSEKGVHRRFKLAKLLQMDVNRVSHLPTVAEAVAENSHFAGCLISDNDGMMLAETGAAEIAESLSAVLPKVFSQLQDTMDIVDVGHVDSISMGIEGRMFTSVSIGRICLTAIHEKNKLTKAQLVLIGRVAEEISWMLSHRGYVGR